jgi:hypothetical protein
VALSGRFVVKLVDWVWTGHDDFLALESCVIKNVICLTAVSAALGGSVVVIIAGTSADALFGDLVESLVDLAHGLAGQNVTVLV